MTPQTSMTIFLTVLILAGIFRQAKDGETPAKAVGGTLGIMARYGTIIAILWWGGFYGA